MKRILSSVLLVMMAVTLASCGSEKGAATAAIQAAETAWASAKDNVMKVMPTDAKSIDDAIAAAKASLGQGDAKAALATAKDLPAKIQQLTAGLAAKEAELRGQWGTLSAGLPGVMEAVQKRVDVLSKARHLPAGLDPTAFAEVKGSMANATQMWTEAQSAQQSGNIAEAMTKAVSVKDLLVKALTTLKMPVPAALSA